MAGKKVGVHGTDKETGRAADKKTTCLVSREQFTREARPLKVTIEGVNLGDEKRTLIVGVSRNKETGEVGFSTGSLGWYGNEKINTLIDGEEARLQVAVTVTVIGSKELPK